MNGRLEADLKRNHIRFPRVLSLRSAFEYLRRAYTAERQPAKHIDEGLTFLEDLGFWFTWTGEEWGLQCRSCGTVYVRSGTARNHKCSGPLGASSFGRAKEPFQPLEDPSVTDPMSWDLPDAETSFDHVTQPTDSQPSSEPELSVEDVDFSIEVGAHIVRFGRLV